MNKCVRSICVFLLSTLHYIQIYLANFMETPAFFYGVFLWCLLISVTGYSIYIGFGPPSKDLRDPFEEHED